MRQIFQLNGNWVLSPVDAHDKNLKLDFPEKGIPATVPGTVHTDLLAAGLIPDPYYSDNELRLQWITEVGWQYENNFDLPADLSQLENIRLVFEGIDTAAKIYLNEKMLGESNNMFLSYRFDVSKILKPKNNSLKLVFEPPLAYARRNKREIEQFSSARHSDRVFIRKAQYSFGWDWGPIYPTSGIWRPLFLEKVDKAKIKNINWEVDLKSEKMAIAKAKINMENFSNEKLTISAKLEKGDFQQQKTVSTDSSGLLEMQFDIESPDLWWPKGYGQPNLYDLVIEISDSSGDIHDKLTKKVGIRKIDLDLKVDGKPSFRFKINNLPVFLKGANWIPGDLFLPRFNKDKQRELLDLADNANMNVLRVWGGGIYEEDLFYDLCDEKGIMVWQDFMFACAAYPEDEKFIDELVPEFKENIKRLQFHPSVLVWCGNNENEWIWYRDSYRPLNEMPGYKIFHDVLPKLIAELDPTRPYWPSSPFGDDIDPNDQRTGNRHQWDVWSGWVDYVDVVKDESHFVSEFGFQGPANFHTLKNAIPEADFYPQSRIFEFHNKQDAGPERIHRFLSGHLPIPIDMSSYIYLAQLNQAFALKSCLEHWRMRWPLTAGSIIWQINDCWPVTSWALIDSESIPKLSYFEVKRVFDDTLITFIEDADTILLKISSHIEKSGKLEIVKIPVNDDKIEYLFNKNIDLAGDQFGIRELFSLKKSDLSTDETMIASWYGGKGKLISRNYYSPQRWKHMTLPKRKGVEVVYSKKNNSIVVSSESPVFFPEFRHPDLWFSDNGFILLPGEKKEIEIKGIPGADFNSDDIEIFCLNDYLQNKI